MAGNGRCVCVRVRAPSQEPAQCCRKCGVVKNAETKLIVLPNMLGHFGPPINPGYRGDGAAQAMMATNNEKEQKGISDLSIRLK